jgi:F-type H+-transporting ATPase subunit b
MTVTDTHSAAIGSEAVADGAIAGHTEVASHGGDHGPELLGLNAEGWVYVALSLFILLAFTVGKAWQKITAGLDARIAETRRTLDEAEALRNEAGLLLADARKRHQASAGDATKIVEGAQAEAAALVAQAETDAQALIARREQSAKERIAVAERQAIADIRATAVSAAATAAVRLIEAKLDTGGDAALVDEAIAEI